MLQFARDDVTKARGFVPVGSRRNHWEGRVCESGNRSITQGALLGLATLASPLFDLGFRFLEGSMADIPE